MGRRFGSSRSAAAASTLLVDKKGEATADTGESKAMPLMFRIKAQVAGAKVKAEVASVAPAPTQDEASDNHRMTQVTVLARPTSSVRNFQAKLEATPR